MAFADVSIPYFLLILSFNIPVDDEQAEEDDDQYDFNVILFLTSHYMSCCTLIIFSNVFLYKY